MTAKLMNARDPLSLHGSLNKKKWMLKHGNSSTLPLPQAKSPRQEDRSTSSLSSLNQARTDDTVSLASAIGKPPAEHLAHIKSTQESPWIVHEYRKVVYSQWMGHPLITAKFEYIPNIDQLRAIDKLAELVYSEDAFRTAVDEKLGWDWKRVLNMYVSYVLDQTNRSVSVVSKNPRRRTSTSSARWYQSATSSRRSLAICSGPRPNILSPSRRVVRCIAYFRRVPGSLLDEEDA